MSYNPYYNLTPMERLNKANADYLKFSRKNIINQEKQLEKASEPFYEGKIITEDEGPDVSSELSIIDDNFRFLNVNINKLKDALSKVDPPGPTTKPKKPKKPADPNNLTQSEIDKLDAYNKELSIYQANLQAVKALKKIDTIQKEAFNTYVENITKCIFNLNSIIDNTKDIVKTIRDEGEEIFDFSQLDNTYKLYSKFLKEYFKFRKNFEFVDNLRPRARHQYDYLMSEFILTDAALSAEDSAARGVGPIRGLERVLQAWEYTVDFNELCEQVVTLYEGIKTVSQEKGTRKLQYEGAGRYQDQRAYHWAWM